MRKVEVVPYDINWPSMYAIEAKLLSAVLGAELVRIHHIGSTSVPGLQAKPIDMLAEVRDINALDSLNNKMIASGYTPKGEYDIPGRRYFFKGSPNSHTHHLHAFAEGHPEVARHLLFRNYLCTHPSEAQAYGGLKASLAARFSTDIEAYMDGKDALIKEIENKAALWSKSNASYARRTDKS